MIKQSTALKLAAIVLAGGLLAVFAGMAGADEEGGPKVDGVLVADEYQHCIDVDDIDMTVCWSITDHDLIVGVKAPAAGWVGFGLRPGVPPEGAEKGMDDVDFMIGYVKDGKTFASDDWGDSPFSHKADADLGGAYSIEEAAGTEKGGYTTIEFERLLNTQDEYDNDVPARGEVYLAYSDFDDFVSMHKAQHEIVLNYVTGAVEEEEEEEEH